MSKALLYLSVSLCLCGELSASPATVPASQPVDPVESIIAELSADDWSAREEAQDKLVTMGADVMDRLQRVVAESSNEEARQRAGSAMAQIRQRQQTGASLITLHVKNAALRDVFDEISRQCGAPLQPLPPELWELRPWPKVSFDFDRQPFWIVMRAIAEQTGIELKAWNSDGLHLIQGAPAAAANGRWTVTGPFLITLHRASRNQSVDYGANDAINSDFVLTFSGIAEPKLRVVRSSYLARLDEATDDRGNSLLLKDETEDAARRGGLDLAFTGNTTGQWQFTARLANVREMGSKLTVLRGSALVQLQTRAETLEVPNILSANNATRSVAGVTLTVREVKKLGDRYEVNLLITRDGHHEAQQNTAIDDPIDWQRVQQSLVDLKLLDDNGRALERGSFSSGGSDQRTEVTMSFSAIEATPGARHPTGAPSKLVWRVATEVRDVVIPFEFREVPLPQ